MTHSLLFTPDEFRQRVARTQKLMRDAGIDVLLVSNPANQFWLTGYDGWSFYTPQMVVLPVDADEPFWFGRKMDAVGAKFTAFLAPENVIPYPDIYVGTPDRHPMQFLVQILKERGLDRGRIAAEQDDYYYTAKWNRILTEGLGQGEFADGFLLVNRARMVKSETELRYMSEAGQIAGAAMEAARQAARPGVRQCDVMAEVYRVTTAGLPGMGGTFPCKPPNAMVGELASAPHLSWTDAPLQEGEIFYIELGGIRHRYHCPLSRCIYVGTPPAELVRTTADHPRGAGGRARCRAPRRAVRGSRGGVEARHLPPRDREGLAHRLPRRHRLPAHLGRADMFPARRRQDGDGGKHDLPRHPRALAGGPRARRLRKLRGDADGASCFADYPRELLSTDA
jgi:ectoine hydrolase